MRPSYVICDAVPDLRSAPRCAPQSRNLAGGWTWCIYLDGGQQKLEVSRGDAMGYESARTEMSDECEAEKRRRRPALLGAQVPAGGHTAAGR